MWYSGRTYNVSKFVNSFASNDCDAV